jgi:hypothetical protein
MLASVMEFHESIASATNRASSVFGHLGTDAPLFFGDGRIDMGDAAIMMSLGHSRSAMYAVGVAESNTSDFCLGSCWRVVRRAGCVMDLG